MRVIVTEDGSWMTSLMVTARSSDTINELKEKVMAMSEKHTARRDVLYLSGLSSGKRQLLDGAYIEIMEEPERWDIKVEVARPLGVSMSHELEILQTKAGWECETCYSHNDFGSQSCYLCNQEPPQQKRHHAHNDNEALPRPPQLSELGVEAGDRIVAAGNQPVSSDEELHDIIEKVTPTLKQPLPDCVS